MTLIERIEAATGPDRELFWEAFNAAFPEPAPGCEPVWRPENPKQPIYHAWKTRQVAFRRFVDAEAWEQAALLLVPDDWHMELRGVNASWHIALTHTPLDSFGQVYAFSSAQALTIICAALRAREASRDA